MAMLDGKPKKHMSGGNVERENFMDKAMKPAEKKAAPKEPKGEPDGDEPTTTITHHADGTHTAVHSDGQTDEKMPLGHHAMMMHSKHGDGEAGHIHAHMDGATTHHVGMDGQVQGPNDHASVGEAADHMKQMLGEDGGNGAVEQAGPPQHGVGNLY